MTPLFLRALAHWNFRRVEECETLLAWLDPRPGERILDVGCGDGYWDSRISRRGALVVGVDLDPGRLAVAERHRLPGQRFHLVSAEAMELPAASFDKALSLCAIEHFADDERVLANVARAVRPGGELVLSADSLSNPELTPVERETHRRRFAVNTFYTVDVLREKLDRAGFDLAETRYILTSPLTLALVRWSWRLEDLRVRGLVPLAIAGEALLGTAGLAAALAADRLAARGGDAGLTLLARATRR